MPKLFSDNLNQTAITGREIGTVIGRLTIGFPQRAGDYPKTFPMGDRHDSLEERPLLLVDYPKESGDATETRNHTQISLSLSHSFRKFLVLRILPLANVELPEGFKGQNGQRKMSLSSIGN